MKRNSMFSKKLLDLGFATALVLAFACLLITAVYLFTFLRNTNTSVENLLDRATKSQISQPLVETAIFTRLATTRITFLSCGVFVGMSFGFLGFGLFLMGIKEEMDVSGSAADYKVRISRMSPGCFVLLASIVLIGFCIAHQMPFDYQRGVSNPLQESPSPSPPDTTGTIKP